MKVIILTSSVYGTAGHHLPILFNCRDIEIAMVVVCGRRVTKLKDHYLKRIKKIIKIGVLGALNGIRMRKWYTGDMSKYCQIINAEEFCKQHNIPFKRVPYTNSDETRRAFTESAADIGLSLGNDYISKKVFTIPKFGMLNIHHELLPGYQNAQSIIWELYNGSTETGYTIHKIDRHIDTGEIILQEKLAIIFRDTLSDTVAFNYAQLFDASSKGLAQVFNDFDKYFLHAKSQGRGSSYTTPSLRQYFKMSSQFEKLSKGNPSK